MQDDRSTVVDTLATALVRVAQARLGARAARAAVYSHAAKLARSSRIVPEDMKADVCAATYRAIFPEHAALVA